MSATASESKELADLKRHAERMAKALRLLIPEHAALGAGVSDTRTFAMDALIAWDFLRGRKSARHSTPGGK